MRFDKNIFQKNRGTKLAAAVIAVITWYAVRLTINYVRTVPDVPLTIRVDDGWAILDRSAQNVDVTFRGAQEDVRNLNASQVKVVVDLRGKTREGTLTIRLKPKNVSGSGVARPIAIRPDEIVLSLDQQAEKTVPVKADLQGSPPDGFEVESLACTPATVKLTGPQKRLAEVDSLRTAPVDIEGRTRSFKKLKVAVLPPSENWVAKMEPETVAVEIGIAERATTRSFADVPVWVMADPARNQKIAISSNRVTVTLRGRAELLRSLKPRDVQAYVDVRELDGGASYELPVRVVAPSGASLASAEPASIKVELLE